MKINRRQFNIFSGLSLLSFSRFSAKAEVAPANYTGLYILQGATDDSSTLLSVMAPKSEVLNFEIFEIDTGNFHTPKDIQFEDRSHSDWRVYTIHCDRLSLAFEYELKVKNSNGKVLDTRQFGLLDHQNKLARFALGSCMEDFQHKDWIWQSLYDSKPSVLFLLGDNVYADKISRSDSKTADEVQVWSRYVQVRLTLELFRFRRLIPVFSGWDDHDTGKNNCNREYKQLPNSLKVFSLFFPCDERISIVSLGPGNSKLIKTFGQDFYFLDGRSFRSEKGAVDETMFGVAQEDWLLLNVNKQQKSWLMAGTQWFTPYSQAETFLTTHPNAFTVFMKKLKLSGAKIVFCSGDVHFSEVTKVEQSHLGYETLEFTASSFHSSHLPGMDRFLNNPGRLASKATRNFMMFECEEKGDSLVGSVQCVSKNQKSKFDLDFEVFGSDLVKTVKK